MIYLWLEQKGDGCDYSINCGEVLIPLDSDPSDTDGIKKEVRKIFEYYGVTGERALQDAKVVSLVSDVMDAYREYAEEERRKERAGAQLDKLVELEREVERLKKKLEA